MEIELYKIRSLGGCLKAANDLFNSNIKTILRKTWLPAVFVSLVVSCFMLLEQPMGLTGASPSAHLRFFGIVGVLMLAALVAGTWFNTVVVGLLNGRSLRANLPRVIRLTLLGIGIAVIIGLVAGGTEAIILLSTPAKGKDFVATMGIALAASMAVVLVAGAVLIPTVYSTLKYLIEPEQKVMSVLGKPYREGWRRWGFLFMAGLLTGIILTIIYMVTQFPAFLVKFGQVANSHGMLMGDASGLPGYFSVLAFIVTVVCTFVWMYATIWSFMVAYYVYGSIEQKLRERQQDHQLTTV
jgi:MFS family permease